MQAISDKIRHYRKTFPSLFVYALGTRVMWLCIVLMALILFSIFLNRYLRTSTGIELFSGWNLGILFVFEMFLVPGLLQAFFMGGQRRYRRHQPLSTQPGFRISIRHFNQSKLAYLRSHFVQEGDVQALAKALVDEWEWRREMKSRAQEPVWHKVLGFFCLPSAANFAAYMTGLVAIIAGIVIATMDRELLFGSFEQLVKDAWDLICLLWINLIPLVVLCILPGAMIIGAFKYVAERGLEWLDDQYLSHAAFYRFIAELLDLHDRGERDLMRKTRGRVYWSVRLGMAPIQDVPRIWRRVKRAKRLARLRSQTLAY
jgi:hypothetical protein